MAGQDGIQIPNQLSNIAGYFGRCLDDFFLETQPEIKR